MFYTCTHVRIFRAVTTRSFFAESTCIPRRLRKIWNNCSKVTKLGMHLGKTLNLLVTNFQKFWSSRTDSKAPTLDSVQKWPYNTVISSLEWEIRSEVSKMEEQNYLFCIFLSSFYRIIIKFRIFKLFNAMGDLLFHSNSFVRQHNQRD